MSTFQRLLVSAAALAVFISPASIATRASAQEEAIPVYGQWLPAWDRNQYDTRHVMLGVVVGFSPYRLTVQRRNGIVQTIDLKNGTIIRPTGATPTQGERVALVGYYSNGTFIANSVVLRA